MKTIMTLVTVAAIVLMPATAFAGKFQKYGGYQNYGCVHCTAYSTKNFDDHYGSGYDDPNIPNCVMSPTKAYAGGTCERVALWTNFGSSYDTCISETSWKTEFKGFRRNN